MFSKLFDKYISQKNLYFLILLILFLLFLCKNIDIAIMIFVAIIFSTALNPLVDKLAKKINRPLATTIVLLTFILIVAAFVVPVLYLAITEIAAFAKEFPQYINNINGIISKMPLLKTVGITNISTTAMSDWFSDSSVNIFEQILNFTSQAGTAFLYIFTAIVLLFFFLVDKNQIKNSIVKLFPCEYRKKTEKILSTLNAKLSGYVFAQVIVSGSVWIVMTIGLLAFHVQYAILLGVISGVLSIIPIVGSGISLIICLIATYEMGLKYLIIVTVLYTFSHFVENHLVRPYVYSKFLNLHQVIIFLALIVGAKYQGVLGVILAPPFAMALYILLEELYIKKMEE